MLISIVDTMCILSCSTLWHQWMEEPFQTPPRTTYSPHSLGQEETECELDYKLLL